MIKKLTLWFCGLTFLVIITTGLLQYNIGGEVLSSKIHSLRDYMFLFRVLFFVGLFGYWHQIMGWVSKRQEWSESQLELATNSRWKIALYIGLIEVFIIQNLGGKLLAEFISGAS